MNEDAAVAPIKFYIGCFSVTINPFNALKIVLPTDILQFVTMAIYALAQIQKSINFIDVLTEGICLVMVFYAIYFLLNYEELNIIDQLEFQLKNYFYMRMLSIQTILIVQSYYIFGLMLDPERVSESLPFEDMTINLIVMSIQVVSLIFSCQTGVIYIKVPSIIKVDNSDPDQIQPSYSDKRNFNPPSPNSTGDSIDNTRQYSHHSTQLPQDTSHNNDSVLNVSNVNNLTKSEISELITFENFKEDESEDQRATMKLNLKVRNSEKKTPAEQVSCALKSQDFALDEIDKKKGSKDSIVKKVSRLK